MTGNCCSASALASSPSLTSSAGEYLFSGGVIAVWAAMSNDRSRCFMWPWLCKKESGGSDAAEVEETTMPETTTRAQLIERLNEDLAREYQAIIAYVVYSQVLKGAEYMSIAGELEKHAHEELEHALVIAKQIDYLGGMPTVTVKPVKVSKNAEDMLRFDLDNENETI